MGEAPLLIGRCRREGVCICAGKLGCDREASPIFERKFSLRETHDKRQLFGACRTKGVCACGLCQSIPPPEKVAAVAFGAPRFDYDRYILPHEVGLIERLENKMPHAEIASWLSQQIGIPVTDYQISNLKKRAKFDLAWRKYQERVTR